MSEKLLIGFSKDEWNLLKKCLQKTLVKGRHNIDFCLPNFPQEKQVQKIEVLKNKIRDEMKSVQW